MALPSLPPDTRSRSFLFVALTLGAAVFCLYVFAAIETFRFGPKAGAAGWTYRRAHGNWQVQSVDPIGPAKGKLETGDQILSLMGDARYRDVDPGIKLRQLASGQPYAVHVSRRGAESDVQLELSPYRAQFNMVWALSLLAVGLVFYAVGMLMGVLRPGFSLTRLGCISALVSATHIASLSLRPVQALLSGVSRGLFVFANAAAPWHMALGYHFFSRFPSAIPETPAWRFTRWFIYAYCALLALPRTILSIVSSMSEESAIDYYSRNAGWIGAYDNNVATLENVFRVFVAFAMCAVLIRNYRALAGAKDLQRRVKWVALAAALGILLPGLLSLLTIIRRGSPMPLAGAYPGNIILTNLVSAIVPLALGYAVLKYRVLGVDAALRSGFRYLLAKNFLRLLLLLPVLAIGWSVIADPHRTIGQMLMASPVHSYAIVAAGAAVSLKYRRPLGHWVDRRFFREAYDAETVLLSLIEEIKQADTIPEISALAGTQLSQALHPLSVHILCCRTDSKVLTASYSTSTSSVDINAPEQRDLVNVASGSKSSVEFIPGRSVFPKSTAELLEHLGTRLIIPVRDSSQRLIGLILLGEKKSEEPYTGSDRGLLQAVAAQMGLGFDLVWTRERLEKERQVKDNALALLDQESVNLVRECPDCGTCFDNWVQTCPVDQKALETPLLLERTVDSKYRLERKIGKGAYGAVYEALDLRLQRPVAVKVIAGQVLLNHRSAMRRFEREARAVARVNHRNVVAIYDYGRARPEGAYLAMELVRGTSWRSELLRRGAFPSPLAAAWLDQLLAGVAAAHQEGVIHRDLKPENMLIAPEDIGPGVVKILDFGLAKLRLLDPNDPESLTVAGAALGTLGYMSPEQFTGREADERSDIFSLGVITVEALTGRRPFQGHTTAELLRSVLHDPVQVNIQGPGASSLNEIVKRCLAKNPDGRYHSVTELRRDLIPAVHGCYSASVERSPEERVRTATIGS